MKDILIIREERKADEAVLGFIRSRYDSKSIDFDSKKAESIFSTEGIKMIVALLSGTSAASIVELRRMLLYIKEVQFCILGNIEELESYKELFDKENVHCIELPLPMDVFQKQFTLILRMHDNLNYLLDEDSAHKHSILLVDDDPVCLRNMMNWLKNFYQIAMVKSGAACISYLGKARPDLILLDYEMPVCNGVQTLEMIRSEPEYADIPVIFLTSVSDTEKVKEAIKLKPQGYVLKNSGRVDFLNKINSVFGY